MKEFGELPPYIEQDGLEQLAHTKSLIAGVIRQAVDDLKAKPNKTRAVTQEQVNNHKYTAKRFLLSEDAVEMFVFLGMNHKRCLKNIGALLNAEPTGNLPGV